jgi:hypothetical protein
MIRISLISILLLVSPSIFGQISAVPLNENTISLVTSTVGYYLGSIQGLERVEKELPTKRQRALLSKLKFQDSYSTAYENMLVFLNEAFGKEGTEKLLSNMLHETDSLMHIDPIETLDIDEFIDNVNRRCEGIIESPYREVLFHFKYIDHPQQEITDRHFVIFETTGSTKSTGLDIKIKVPSSYKAEDGMRPHVIQNFASLLGEGGDHITFLINKIPDPTNQLDAKTNPAIISETQIRDLFEDENNHVLNYKKVEIDGIPFAVIETTNNQVSPTGVIEAISLIYISRLCLKLQKQR